MRISYPFLAIWYLLLLPFQGLCRRLTFSPPVNGYVLLGHVIKNVSLNIYLEHFQTSSEDCRRRLKKIRRCCNETLKKHLSVVKGTKEKCYQTYILTCEDIISFFSNLAALLIFVTFTISRSLPTSYVFATRQWVCTAGSRD